MADFLGREERIPLLVLGGSGIPVALDGIPNAEHVVGSPGQAVRALLEAVLRQAAA